MALDQRVEACNAVLDRMLAAENGLLPVALQRHVCRLDILSVLKTDEFFCSGKAAQKRRRQHAPDAAGAASADPPITAKMIKK